MTMTHLNGRGSEEVRLDAAAIRVAVLDDHPAMRAGLEAMLAPAPDLRFVGAAGGEEDLWGLLAREQPTVLTARAAGRLDPSDHAIFAMRLAGNSPAEIADTLSLSIPMVGRRIARIAELLADSPRPALVAGQRARTRIRPRPSAVRRPPRRRRN
jgi:DNA-binding CsgD family transcriptional regulator